jgi:hypothetical protein
MEYLEQLAREWYEYQGYFVRTDLWVGLEDDGSYECELCVVAFHPTRHHIVHIEPGFDLLSWKDREQHFKAKFDAGRKYLHRLFGLEPHVDLEQIALVLESGGSRARTIGGGRILLLADFLAEILQRLSRIEIATSMVPEQWPLILSLQFVADNRERLVAALGSAPAKASG